MNELWTFGIDSTHSLYVAKARSASYPYFKIQPVLQLRTQIKYIYQPVFVHLSIPPLIGHPFIKTDLPLAKGETKRGFLLFIQVLFSCSYRNAGQHGIQILLA